MTHIMPQRSPSRTNFPEGTARVLQINLNHCRLAQDILFQNSAAFGADIVAVSEPWRCPSQWFSCSGGGAAVFVPASPSRFPSIKPVCVSRFFVAVDFGVFVLYSVYIPPSIPVEAYEEVLSSLASQVVESGTCRCVLMGDFNAKSPLWGSDRTDRRGSAVVDFLGRLDLTPVRSEGSYTFERNGHRSLIDIVLCGRSVRVSSSKILQEYSASDHFYLLHTLGHAGGPLPPSAPSSAMNTSLGNIPVWSPLRIL